MQEECCNAIELSERNDKKNGRDKDKENKEHFLIFLYFTKLLLKINKYFNPFWLTFENEL